MVSSAFSFIISNVSPLCYPDIPTVAKLKTASRPLHNSNTVGRWLAAAVSSIHKIKPPSEREVKFGKEGTFAYLKNSLLLWEKGDRNSGG